jgi:hypothetical protein
VSFGADPDFGGSGDNRTVGDEDYDQFGNVKILWGLLGAAQDAPSAADFAPEVPGLLAEKPAI